MEIVFEWLTAAGYPQEGVAWLRKHRAWVIVVLAIAAWMPFLALGWIVWRMLN